jgi:hypothetical protein
MCRSESSEFWIGRRGGGNARKYLTVSFQGRDYSCRFGIIKVVYLPVFTIGFRYSLGYQKCEIDLLLNLGMRSREARRLSVRFRAERRNTAERVSGYPCTICRVLCIVWHHILPYAQNESICRTAQVEVLEHPGPKMVDSYSTNLPLLLMPNRSFP